MPGAREAYLNDPVYSASLKWMRRALSIVDMAMEDENIPYDVRVRVIRTVLYGAPNEDDALDRAKAREQMTVVLKDPPWELGGSLGELFGEKSA